MRHLGKLPKGWRIAKLGDVAKIVMGQSPPGVTVSDWDGEPCCEDGLPFIQGNAEFGSDHPKPKKWCKKPLKVSENGDTLISVRAPVGETNRANDRMAIGRGLAAVRFTRANPDYGWHMVNHAKLAFLRVAQGSTFHAIGGNDVRGLAVVLPPLLQQRAIAATLDAIGEATERTEAVISTTERLRDALLHRLLTRGVRGWHSRWNDVTGLGTIPADWRVLRLGNAGQWLSGGTPPKERSDFWSGTLPWVSPKDMKTRELLDTRDHVSLEGARVGSRVVPEGTIFVVTRGMILAHSFPLAVSRVKAAFNQDIRALLCRDGLLPDFLLAALEHQTQRLLQLPSPSTHGTMRVVSEDLFAIKVAQPSLAEQRAITTTLARVDTAFQALREELDALLLSKVSVAEALLTGRVQVASKADHG